MAVTENLPFRGLGGTKRRAKVTAAAGVTNYQSTMLFVDANGKTVNDHSGGTLAFAGVCVGEILPGEDGEVYTSGTFCEMEASGLTAADIGKAAYAVDNNAVNVTATSQTRVGTIRDVYGTGRALVEFDTQTP